MKAPRVVVVGGGAVGLATALHLARAGWEHAAVSVTVLERDAVASGSSGLSLGIVETQYVDEVDVAARVYGRRFYSSLTQHHELRFVRNGYLRVGETESDLAVFHESVATQARQGVEDSRVLTAPECALVAPGLDVDTVAGGLWGPSDGFLDGHLATTLLADLVTHSGGRVLQRAELLDARVTDGSWELVTSKGRIEADIVVNAAGAWAAHVGEILGAPVPVRAERHQAILIERPRPMATPFPCFIDHVPGSGRDSLSLRGENDTQLLACIHSESATHPVVDPDDYERGCDQAFVEDVVERISYRFPGMEATVGRGWSGLYPMTSDGPPLVGNHPTGGVVCAVGGGGSGIQLAPAIGVLAACAVLGRVDQLPDVAQMWDPARLRTGGVAC